MNDPATHGDVTREYLALARGAGLVTSHHDLVWVRGADALTFLEGLLSQRIEGADEGEVRRSLLLAPNGKLRAALHVLLGSAAAGLVADAGLGATVIGDLSRFKIRVDVTFEPEERPLLEVWGPDAGAVLIRAGLEDPEGWSADPLVARIPFTSGALPRYLIAGVAAERLLAAGAVAAGTQAAEAVRIENGEPVVGVDLDEKTIAQEAGLVSGAVDFDKGCYLGQELLARIDSRGHVNRHLRGVVITENVLPPVGADVVADTKTVGRITSVAESLDLRAPIGLAMLRREVRPGDRVTVRWQGGAVTAVVAALPLRETEYAR